MREELKAILYTHKALVGVVVIVLIQFDVELSPFNEERKSTITPLVEDIRSAMLGFINGTRCHIAVTHKSLEFSSPI